MVDIETVPEPVAHFTNQDPINSDMKEDMIEVYKQYASKDDNPNKKSSDNQA